MAEPEPAPVRPVSLVPDDEYPSWTVEQVAQWLHANECDSAMIDLFRTNKIQGKHLLRLDGSRLTAMGVMAGDQMDFEELVSKLKRKPVAPKPNQPVALRPEYNVNTYAHEQPDQATTYFQLLKDNLTAASCDKVIGICVPCFNETQYGLRNTLRSLSTLKVPEGFTLSVIILMDGVKGSGADSVPAQCTRDYLSDHFGVQWEQFESGGNKQQTTIFEPMADLDPAAAPRHATTLQAVFTYLARAGSATPQPSQDDLSAHMQVSLLVKKKNLRKHNSHQWFMAAFAKELQCQYILCTDCSTVFEPDMLEKLIEHLEAHPQTTAVCGRQRVMAATIQNRGNNVKLEQSEFWEEPGEFALRQIQTYDFEADHPVSKAAYDFLGFLPVLPGPCGLYRYKDLANGRYDKYFETVNKRAEDCGLWLANLKIAEDRIPSLFAVFSDLNDSFATHWVRDAVFYFEAELTLKDLVLQRRRWLNGTNAGYLYILMNMRKYIWSSGHGLRMKLFATAMLVMQLIQIIVLSLGPGIFASILFGTCHFLAVHYSEPWMHVEGNELPGFRLINSPDGPDYAQQAAAIVEIQYLAAYLLFLWVHRIQYEDDENGAQQKKKGSDYKGWAFGLVTVENFFLIIMFLWALSLSSGTFVGTFQEAMDEIDPREPGTAHLYNGCINPDLIDHAEYEKFVHDECKAAESLLSAYSHPYESVDIATTSMLDAATTKNDQLPEPGSVFCCGPQYSRTDCPPSDVTSLSIEFKAGERPEIHPRTEDMYIILRLWSRSRKGQEMKQQEPATIDTMTGKVTIGDRPLRPNDPIVSFETWLGPDPTMQYHRYRTKEGMSPYDEKLTISISSPTKGWHLHNTTTTSFVLNNCADKAGQGCWSNADCEDQGMKGYECQKLPCPIYRRCAKNDSVGITEAATTCGLPCKNDKDCDTGAGEVCVDKLPPAHGCLPRLVGMSFLVGFVLVPGLFAIIDMPISRSFQSPVLMFRSALWYVMFMPTFVAFFSAYSTNRLADVSWGQRAVEDGVDPGQQRIQTLATAIAIVVPSMNVSFAVAMAYLHLVMPDVVSILAGGIMFIASITFVVSLISYVVKYSVLLSSCFGDAIPPGFRQGLWEPRPMVAAAGEQIRNYAAGAAKRIRTSFSRSEEATSEERRALLTNA